MSIASPMRRITATIAASALVAGSAVALGTAAPALAAPVSSTATDLNWNFRTSWVNYVKYTPAWPGSITATDGATYETNGSAATDRTLWDADSVDFEPEDGSGDATFLGDVRYEVPLHGIDTTLSDPHITWDAEGDAELILSVNGSAPVTFATAEVELGDPVIDDTTVSYEVTGTNVVITSEAAAIDLGDGNTFGGYNYVDLSDFTFLVEYELEEATVAAPTTSPASGPVLKGSTTTVSTTVTWNSPAEGVDSGSVEFFALPANNGDAISLGTDTSADANGEFSVSTDTLPGGGYRFKAVYTDGVHYTSGEATQGAAANFGVVDTATGAVCTPATGAESNTSGEGAWEFSTYSKGMAWGATRIVDGDISIDPTLATRFLLDNGTVTADANCVRVEFEGTLGFHNHGDVPRTYLIDPVLTFTKAGEGALVATVGYQTTSGGTMTYSEEPITVLEVASVSGIPAYGESGTATVNFKFANSTAQGTWHKDYSAAWPNEFIWFLPATMRAYYFANSGTDKSALPLSLTFEWPQVDVVVATPAASPAAPVLVGDDVTVSTTVTAGGDAVDEGSVEFFAIPANGGAEISLGTDTTVDSEGTFEVSTDSLVAGGYRFKAVYTDGDTFKAGEAVQASSANYGVLDTTLPPVCTPGAGAKTSNGATATWGWSAYSNAWTKYTTGNVTKNGQNFVLSNGVVTASETCAKIQFTGSLRVAAYEGYTLGGVELPAGVWIELVNPVLTISRDGTGSWAANVRSGAATYTGSEPTTFATVVTIDDVSGLPAVGKKSETTVDFAYSNTVAQGSWHKDYNSAWANEFILLVDNTGGQRSFYYQTGTSTGNLNKVPAAMTVNFGWPPLAEDALPNRIAGPDRYATSAAIVDEFDEAFNPSVVFVATGENYPDALAAAAAAAHVNAPVLLTKKDSLPSVVKAQLNAIKPSTIYVLGSSSTVSNKVVNDLKKISGTPTVKRLAGEDRYATMREIVKTAFGVNGNGDGAENRNLHTVVVATGKNFPDALSAGAAVASVDGAVILVDGSKTSIPTATMNLIKDLEPQRVVIAGSADAVKAKIETQLKSAFPGKVIRKAGKDRYETSIELNKLFYSEADVVFFATGANFPDALSAAPLAGKLSAPLIVTQKSCISKSGKQYVQSLNPLKKVLLGSTATISNNVASLKTC